MIWLVQDGYYAENRGERTGLRKYFLKYCSYPGKEKEGPKNEANPLIVNAHFRRPKWGVFLRFFCEKRTKSPLPSELCLPVLVASLWCRRKEKAKHQQRQHYNLASQSSRVSRESYYIQLPYLATCTSRNLVESRISRSTSTIDFRLRTFQDPRSQGPGSVGYYNKRELFIQNIL